MRFKISNLSSCTWKKIAPEISLTHGDFLIKIYIYHISMNLIEYNNIYYIIYIIIYVYIHIYFSVISCAKVSTSAIYVVKPHRWSDGRTAVWISHWASPASEGKWRRWSNSTACDDFWPRRSGGIWWSTAWKRWRLKHVETTTQRAAGGCSMLHYANVYIMLIMLVTGVDQPWDSGRSTMRFGKYQQEISRKSVWKAAIIGERQCIGNQGIKMGSNDRVHLKRPGISGAWILYTVNE